ncbi:hypothetical protein FACS1894151_09850 [Spirochaetia bacterium]|nr:hypothetical protein FACS1894151_09850 [Spirochaetia bacterium]
MVENKKVILSIRFWHPSMKPKDIINNINLIPNATQTVCENYKLLDGNKINKINKETYVAFAFYKSENNDVANAIENANSYLNDKICFLKKFKQTGGRCEYYITIVSEREYIFILTSETIKVCSDLGIEISVELYADLKKNKSD